MDEFDKTGEPKYFNFFNIYSFSYLERMISQIPGVKGYDIFADTLFDAEKVSAEITPQSPVNITRMVGGWQVNGYILQPWHFFKIDKSSV